MKYINVRQLQRDLEGSTKELPAIVTKNGIPIFTIIPMGIGLTPDGEVADLRGGKYKGEIEEFWPTAPKARESKAARFIADEVTGKTNVLRGEKILEKKIVEHVIKEVPSEKSSERHVCSWDKGFNCKSPGTVFVKGKWWCTPHGLEV